MITAAMRDLLIAHIDGPIQVHIRGQRGTLWKAAFANGFIAGDQPTRPRYSHLTEEGREMLARVLASWADALVRAGYDVKTTPKWSRPERLAA